MTVESFIIPPQVVLMETNAEPNFFQLTSRNTLRKVVLILHASKHLALSFSLSARIFERTETAANGISILARVYCFQSVTTQGRVYYAKTLCPVSSATRWPWSVA